MVSRRPGFTLVEVLVSMAVLSMLLLVLASIAGWTGDIWKSSIDRITTFQDARAGFESMTRRISQSTLNVYWGYEESGGIPVGYERTSELHFIAGPASLLIPNVPDTVTQAIFFQAPLGYTRNGVLRALPRLLNACGYFVQFGPQTDVPNFVRTRDGFEPEYRYRLMQFQQEAEALGVYGSLVAGAPDWVPTDISNGTGGTGAQARPIAENVIALLIRPRLSERDAIEAGSQIALNYLYDSRDEASAETLHQLPPLVEVTMIAIDETSAKRLQDRYGASPPPLIPDGLFQGAATDAQFDQDLEALEAALESERIQYRRFSTIVPIRSAKWSRES